MVTRTRSLVSGLALAVLFFGPSTSNAQAKEGHGDGRSQAPYSRHYGSGHGQHYGHNQHYGYGHYGVGHGYGYISPSYAWGYGPYAQPYVGPYQTVRVFVPLPFPHWVLRRVNYGPPVATPYYSPY